MAQARSLLTKTKCGISPYPFALKMANTNNNGEPMRNGEIAGGGSGPFGMGANPGVFAGETPGNPQSFGPQISQHGSGADVRTAPEGWPPLRPEAAGVDWGIFERARQAARGSQEEVGEEDRAKGQREGTVDQDPHLLVNSERGFKVRRRINLQW